MSDDELIRNLIASYSHFADDKDPDAHAANFTDDGALVDQGVTITPRSKIRQLSATLAAARKDAPTPSGSKHIQVNTVIDVDGLTASAKTDLIYLVLAPETGWSIGAVGRYDDDLVKDGDRWLFKKRVVTWYGGFSMDPLNPATDQAIVGLYESVMATTPENT